jgi:hypothetical protein
VNKPRTINARDLLEARAVQATEKLDLTVVFVDSERRIRSTPTIAGGVMVKTSGDQHHPTPLSADMSLAAPPLRLQRVRRACGNFRAPVILSLHPMSKQQSDSPSKLKRGPRLGGSTVDPAKLDPNGTKEERLAWMRARQNVKRGQGRPKK